MNDFGSLDQGSYAMNNLRQWMTRKTRGHELSALNAMNNLRLWMARTTPSHELSTLDALNNSGLWMR